MESDLVEETSFSAGSSGTSPRTSSSQSAITEENTIIESEPTVQTSDGPSENLTFPQIVVSTSLEILRKSSELLQQVLANSSSEFESKFLRETVSAQLQGILENCQLRVNLMDDVNQWLNEQLSETADISNLAENISENHQREACWETVLSHGENLQSQSKLLADLGFKLLTLMQSWKLHLEEIHSPGYEAKAFDVSINVRTSSELREVGPWEDGVNTINNLFESISVLAGDRKVSAVLNSGKELFNSMAKVVKAEHVNTVSTNFAIVDLAKQCKDLETHSMMLKTITQKRNSELNTLLTERTNWNKSVPKLQKDNMMLHTKIRRLNVAIEMERIRLKGQQLVAARGKQNAAFKTKNEIAMQEQLKAEIVMQEKLELAEMAGLVETVQSQKETLDELQGKISEAEKQIEEFNIRKEEHRMSKQAAVAAKKRAGKKTEGEKKVPVSQDIRTGASSTLEPETEKARTTSADSGKNVASSGSMDLGTSAPKILKVVSSHIRIKRLATSIKEQRSKHENFAEPHLMSQTGFVRPDSRLAESEVISMELECTKLVVHSVLQKLQQMRFNLAKTLTEQKLPQEAAEMQRLNACIPAENEEDEPPPGMLTGDINQTVEQMESIVSQALFAVKQRAMTFDDTKIADFDQWKETYDILQAQETEYSVSVDKYQCLWLDYLRLRIEFDTAAEMEAKRKFQRPKGKPKSKQKKPPHVKIDLPSISPRKSQLQEDELNIDDVVEEGSRECSMELSMSSMKSSKSEDLLPDDWKEDIQKAFEAFNAGAIEFEELMRPMVLLAKLAVVLQQKSKLLGHSYKDLHLKQVYADKIAEILSAIRSERMEVEKMFEQYGIQDYAKYFEELDKLEQKVELEQEYQNLLLQLNLAHLRIRNHMAAKLAGVQMDTIASASSLGTAVSSTLSSGANDDSAENESAEEESAEEESAEEKAAEEEAPEEDEASSTSELEAIPSVETEAEPKPIKSRSKVESDTELKPGKSRSKLRSKKDLKPAESTSKMKSETELRPVESKSKKGSETELIPAESRSKMRSETELKPDESRSESRSGKAEKRKKSVVEEAENKMAVEMVAMKEQQLDEMELGEAEITQTEDEQQSDASITSQELEMEAKDSGSAFETRECQKPCPPTVKCTSAPSDEIPAEFRIDVLNWVPSFSEQPTTPFMDLTDVSFQWSTCYRPSDAYSHEMSALPEVIVIPVDRSGPTYEPEYSDIYIPDTSCKLFDHSILKPRRKHEAQISRVETASVAVSTASLTKNKSSEGLTKSKSSVRSALTKDSSYVGGAEEAISAHTSRGITNIRKYDLDGVEVNPDGSLAFNITPKMLRTQTEVRQLDAKRPLLADPLEIERVFADNAVRLRSCKSLQAAGKSFKQQVPPNIKVSKMTGPVLLLPTRSLPYVPAHMAITGEREDLAHPNAGSKLGVDNMQEEATDTTGVTTAKRKSQRSAQSVRLQSASSEGRRSGGSEQTVTSRMKSSGSEETKSVGDKMLVRDTTDTTVITYLKLEPNRLKAEALASQREESYAGDMPMSVMGKTDHVANVRKWVENSIMEAELRRLGKKCHLPITCRHTTVRTTKNRLLPLPIHFLHNMKVPSPATLQTRQMMWSKEGCQTLKLGCPRHLYVDVNHSRSRARRIVKLVHDRKIERVPTEPYHQHLWNKYLYQHLK